MTFLYYPLKRLGTAGPTAPVTIDDRAIRQFRAWGAWLSSQAGISASAVFASSDFSARQSAASPIADYRIHRLHRRRLLWDPSSGHWRILPRPSLPRPAPSDRRFWAVQNPNSGARVSRPRVVALSQYRRSPAVCCSTSPRPAGLGRTGTRSSIGRSRPRYFPFRTPTVRSRLGRFPRSGNQPVPHVADTRARRLRARGVAGNAILGAFRCRSPPSHPSFTPDNPLQTAPFLIARYDDVWPKPTHARALRLRRRRRSLAR